MAQIQMAQTLTSLTCWVCGINFAMPEMTERKRTEDGKTFWCPNGCKISYGPSLMDTERDKAAAAARRAEMAEAAARRLRERATAAERSVTAYKGQLTRARKRAGAGVCPVTECHRTVSQLAAHMKTRHPDYQP